MSNYFGRVVRVYAGDPRSESIISIDGLRITFSITKTQKRETNNCTLTIWNMAERTSSIFEKIGNSVVIEAGYEGGAGVGVIFAGTIQRSSPIVRGGDRAIEVELLDGSELIRTKEISRTWTGVVQVETIVRDLAISLGVPLKITEPLPQKPYNNGFTAYRGTLQALKKVLDRVRYSYSIQNGELKVYPTGTGDSTTVVSVSSSTGLINYPQKLNDLRAAKQYNNKAGVSFDVLLNPFIQPAGRVFLNSNSVTGELRVDKVSHNGDTFTGDFISTVEAYEL